MKALFEHNTDRKTPKHEHIVSEAGRTHAKLI